MKERNLIPKRFEWWHSIVTVFALNLCLQLTLAPLWTYYGENGDFFTPVRSQPWLWLLVGLGGVGCIYLIRELVMQAVLLVRQLHR